MDDLLVLIKEHAAYEKAHFYPDNKKERLIKALFVAPVKLHCWVVIIDQQLVGFVSFTFDYSTWDAADFMYMDCLFLRAHTRGLGIGTEILRRLKVLAAEKGCVNIQWQTPVFNEPAIKFYHKNSALSKQKVRFTLKVS
jgi:GNAT superfamily N-acetyltransferase